MEKIVWGGQIMFIRMINNLGLGRAWMLVWTLKCVTIHVLVILRVPGGHHGL